jgi:hypothetical protein
VFSDLLTERSAGLVAVSVVRKTTRSYFSFNESGCSPLFTEKMLRNNRLTTTPSLYYISQLIIGSLHPDIGPCLVEAGFRSLSQHSILEERSDEESVPP